MIKYKCKIKKEKNFLRTISGDGLKTYEVLLWQIAEQFIMTQY